MDTRDEEEKHAAPEGGWGWIVCLAYAVNNMIIIPGFQIFSLLYHDVFKDNGFESEMSVVVSVNAAFGMFLGLLNGPILGTFSYRKVAITGASLMFIGNLMTSRSTSFVEFLIFYSCLVSVGANLVMASYTLALNTYFVRRRGMATGIAMTATGVGPIIMPLFVKYLMTSYGSAKYAGLIIAALSLHSFVGALLLQPVKWHRRTNVYSKAPIIKANTTPIKEEIPLKEMNGETSLLKNGADTKPEDDAESNGSCKKSKSAASSSSSSDDENEDGKSKKKEDQRSGDKKDSDPEEGKQLLEKLRDQDEQQKKAEASETTKSRRRLIDLFNFQLFKDFGYVSIIVGLSLAFVGEMNFSLMFPSVLQQMSYNIDETAVFMSVLAIADICSRFTTPFLNKYSRRYARLFFTLSLVFGLFAKSGVILFKSSYSALVVVAIALGVAKGFRSVYMTLIIPNYVSLDLLPSATGIQMFSNGLALGLMGKIFGVVNTKYGNNAWILTINCFTLATIILWTVEYLVKKKTKRKPSRQTGLTA
ncbi:unnamed protein product [Bemisia tabaci]|uniref:Uncharacterized protein n=1 Tax=Bemisia tabaci TaxID=7038 RepID=A0A9P0AD50_BEMTA|nr:PREDICTED: monocarboxylate transporter 9-like [Bemisia tabaci]CAH0391881.1 unnamed protein product [Bemisia tabaci]